jgi:hypothetical protein
VNNQSSQCRLALVTVISVSDRDDLIEASQGRFRELFGPLKDLVELGPQSMKDLHNLILFFKWTQNAHR